MLKNYHTTNQARIITALILTGILSVGSGLTLNKNATAASVNSLPETTNEISKDNLKSNRLPASVAKAVLQDLARTEQVPITELKIVDYSQKTWRNGCLGLPQPNEFCTQALVPGWQVVVSNGRRKWTYHTNSNGRSLRLATPLLHSDNPSSKLPASVRNNVLQAASRRLQQPISQLTIIQAQQQTWRDGCLNLGGIDELCLAALTPGWQVTVSAVDQVLVYHTNQTGSTIRVNEKASETTGKKLPANVRNAVLRQATKVSGLPSRVLSIVDFIETNWVDGCDRSTYPNPCDPVLLSGWQVTVGAGNQRWLVLSNQDGSQVKLVNSNNPVANLPQSIVDQVLADASSRARIKIAVSAKNIIEAKQVVWSNGCLDLAGNVCTLAEVPGWRVTVAIDQQKFVYHTDNYSLVKFNPVASQIIGDAGTIQPVTIPASELPPPLDQGVVFREISTGGFTGRTYETVLLQDGRLIRVRIGDANDSERSVRRISRQQVRQFEQLLKRSRFVKYTNLSYPAPSGAADYITYTVTSQQGTVQYNDISQNNLPQNLQSVVKGWNQIKNSQDSSNNTLQPVPIPASELPPPLDQGVVFREISSGGFTGRTYETVLLQDGLVIRVRIGDANDSERSVRRITLQEVRQFEQLLRRSRFGEYRNLSYPAPSGAADYITYTVTSQQGTVQYNDISQSNLPENLQSVVNGWNEILSNAQSL
ncbi:hypothetical protein NIES4103_17420 [Nostoc sp. NIES-4103]|nr:hypothetical protein NIES4103_17420 [Nostoc sp. NIES-4103]